ncbi:hypothetical protein FQA39_LY19262 [Lamprigera yunnana]|nr:hypothetical protein FQA39_LY19262 [Lamprigera yunnana]
MYKLLVICLCFKLADFSLTIKTEKRVVEEYVLRIVERIVSPETTVLYVYNKTNNYQPKEMVNPKITVDITKTIFNTNIYKTYNELVILDLQSMSIMLDYTHKMIDVGLTNLKETLNRKFLVIVPDLSTFDVKRMFKIYYVMDMINLIIVTFNPKSVNNTITVYTCDLHFAINRGGNFVRVLQSYKYETIKSMRLPGVLDKYKNCVVKHTITDASMLKKNVSKLQYLTYFIKKMISKTLNVTIEPMFKEDFKESEMLGISVNNFSSLLGPEFFSLSVRPRSLFLPSVNKIITMLTESGLLGHHRNLYKAPRVNSTVDGIDSEGKIVLTLSHVYPVFAFWGIGMGFATGVFLAEHIVHYIRNIQTNNM